MQKKFLSIGSLALLQIIIVGNLQILPANAVYGLSLPFLYFLGVIGFFIPCILMVAELSTTHPQTGGAYIWAEKAFGKKLGFFTIAMLWISNLLWYPSIFSLIAANLAYLFDPALAHNKQFVVGFSLIFFWSLTGLNVVGVKFSSRFSVFCSLIGIILPMLLMMVCALLWWATGKPIALSLAQTPLIPDLSSMHDLGYLIAIAVSLFGIELTSVHSGNVLHPKRDFPISLLFSGIAILILLLGSELAIAVIIPAAKLSVVTGLLDALSMFFQLMHLEAWIHPVLFLVLIGNVGSVAAWMLGSTRGMFVACQHNHSFTFLQKENKALAPVGVLLFEAIMFTCVCGVFLLFPHISQSFWLLLDLASQVSLIYYIILFISAMRLRSRPSAAKGFRIPGGKIVFFFIMSLGSLTSLLALILGFLPPSGLDPSTKIIFHVVMIAGLIIAIVLPGILVRGSKYQQK